MRTTDILWGSPNELATSALCSGLWVALWCCYPSIKVATDWHFKPSQKHSPQFPCNCSQQKYSKQILEAFLEAGRLATVSKQTASQSVSGTKVWNPTTNSKSTVPLFLSDPEFHVFWFAPRSWSICCPYKFVISQLLPPDSNLHLHLLIKLLYTLTGTTTEHFIRCDNLRGS